MVYYYLDFSRLKTFALLALPFHLLLLQLPRGLLNNTLKLGEKKIISLHSSHANWFPSYIKIALH